MNWLIGLKPTIGFGIALLLVILIGLVAYDTAQQFVETNRRVTQTVEVLGELEATLARVTEAETNQRGYVITGYLSYVDAYNAARRGMQKSIEHLEKLIADNPDHEVRLGFLGILLEDKFAITDNAIELRTDGGFQAAQQLALVGRGTQIMDNIRAIIETMKAEESELLENRRAQAEATARNTFLACTVFTLLAGGLLSFVFLLINRDIARRERAEESARRYADEVRDLYDHAPCGYHSVDNDGVFVQINQTELSWLGYTREELIGKLKFSDVITSASLPVMQENFPVLKLQGWVSDLEFEMKRKDGSTFIALVNATSIVDKDGNFLRTRSTVVDITDRKRIEEQIRHLNQDLERRTGELEAINKELEAFTYSVSHDLRAPLRAMGGFAKQLHEKYESDLPERAQHYLGRIQQNAEKMGRLIDDLLTLSRLGRQALSMRSANLREIVRDVLRELNVAEEYPETQITLNDLPVCQADPTLLKQVYLNLITNALKFSSTKAAPHIHIGFREEQGECIYFVKDNGIGFDMQFADKLFGVFERLHSSNEFDGTGVGLATVSRIVHRHGGRVWADAVPDEGAVFFFTLQGEPEYVG